MLRGERRSRKDKHVQKYLVSLGEKCGFYPEGTGKSFRDFEQSGARGVVGADSLVLGVLS